MFQTRMNTRKIDVQIPCIRSKYIFPPVEIICVRRVRYSEVYEYFAAQISGLKISISGLKIWISGLKIWISGLKILIFGLKIWISSLNISISGQRNSGPPPKEWFQILAPSRRNGSKFWPPPEGMVPNFEPKNDLKKGQICVFGSFLGPNGPFRLFSHHILCPTGLMKE